MNLKARIDKLSERINGLNLRERALLLLAVLAVIFLIWDVVLMNPVRERQEHVRADLEQVRNQVSELSTGIQQLATARASDPNIELRARIESLEAETDALEDRLASSYGDIAEPRQALDTLSGLLSDRPGLDLVTLENRPVQTLGDDQGNPVPGVFVHRIRVVVETDHDGVRDYLALISGLPSGIFLESMRLDVPDWPTNRVELMLFSLTLDENWLGV